MKQLSKNELQVLQGLAKGLDNQAIADEIGCGYPSVSGAVARIRYKLDVTTREDAVAKAKQLAIITTILLCSFLPISARVEQVFNIGTGEMQTVDIRRNGDMYDLNTQDYIMGNTYPRTAQQDSDYNRGRYYNEEYQGIIDNE